MRLKFTLWKVIFAAILTAGLYATFLRFDRGLGGSTNLSDAFPWGIWIGFDVLCGVMLAAGGFTLMAVVYIFNLQRFRPIVRPTLLTAFLGYLLVCFALLYDLGRGYNIWHPLIMWNPHSVMFEVAWCVMLYTTVLMLEFAPVVLEKLQVLNLERLSDIATRTLRILRFVSVPVVIAGILLSTLHQSSLGSLYLIVPGKLHPLWYSPLLPVFFFISSIAVGLGMTIYESTTCARHFGRRLELPLLRELGRILLVVLLAYATLRFQDLYHRGAFGLVFRRGYEGSLFVLEAALSSALPIIALFIPRVRNSAHGLYVVSIMVVLGFITNRLNVSITGMEASTGVRYLPKWSELAVTAMIVAIGFTAFATATKYLPIFGEEPTGRKRAVR